MQNENLPASDENIPIRRGRLGSVIVYDVRKDELELLEKGGEATIQLNFAVFLYSITLASFIALVCTKDFRWANVNIIFVIVSIFSFIFGTYFTIIWRRSKKSITNTVLEIRNRLNGQESDGDSQDDTENEPHVPPKLPTLKREMNYR